MPSAPGEPPAGSVRVPFDPGAADFLDPAALDREARRIFDICHGCRLCLSFCPSFPALFDAIDGHEERGEGEVAALTPPEIARVVDLCYQCKLCFINCPYTPPHDFAVDAVAAAGEPLDGGDQMGAALACGNGVYLIEDYRPDPLKKGPAAFTGKHYVQAFGGSYEDFRRMSPQRPALIGGGVAAPGQDADLRERLSGPGEISFEFIKGEEQVPSDVVVERLEW